MERDDFRLIFQQSVDVHKDRVFNVWQQLRRTVPMPFEEYKARARGIYPLGSHGGAVAVELETDLFPESRTFWLEAWSDGGYGNRVTQSNLRGFVAACFYSGAEIVAADTEEHPTKIYKLLGFTQIGHHLFATRATVVDP